MTLTAEPRADRLPGPFTGCGFELFSIEPRPTEVCVMSGVPPEWPVQMTGRGQEGCVVQVGLDRHGHLCVSCDHLGDRRISSQESGQRAFMVDQTGDVHSYSYLSI